MGGCCKGDRDELCWFSVNITVKVVLVAGTEPAFALGKVMVRSAPFPTATKWAKMDF